MSQSSLDPNVWIGTSTFLFHIPNTPFNRWLMLISSQYVKRDAILCPGLAVAAPVVAPATAAPIMTCPVSAAIELRLMVRIVLVALIGAALGKEQLFAKHSAGVRTTRLVSMGAAVFTFCSGYGFANFLTVDGT